MSSVEKVDWNRSRIQEAVSYLSSNRTQLPNSIAQTSDTSQRRFKKLLSDPAFSVSRDGKLLYNTLPIVPKEDIGFVLRNLYYVEMHVSGRDKLYEHVKSLFYGISKGDILNFLKHQETYQIHQPIPRSRKRRIVQPLLRSASNQCWAIDLIIMKKHEDSNLSNGVKMRYALNVIDIHSRYAWSVALSRKTPEQVIAGLEEIITDNNSTPPKQILSDNGKHFSILLLIKTLGGEFTDQEFEQFCEDNNIQHIKTTPYQPNQNGAIERWNLSLKSALYKLMTAYNTQRWLELSQKWIEQYNNSIHSTTGFRPRDLQFPQSRAQSKAYSKIATQAIVQKAKETVSKNPSLPELDIGDWVRISHLFWHDRRKNLLMTKVSPYFTHF